MTIGPDEATVQMFGRDLRDRAAWQRAYRAGVRQAAETAQRIRATWPDAVASAEARSVPETGAVERPELLVGRHPPLCAAGARAQSAHCSGNVRAVARPSGGRLDVVSIDEVAARERQ